ncbi:uncharacterized protein LOC130591707 [Beta vulgaris subsp. vulgaris]|uniref:uncharacterized protein LOC130591707 n=1 Tax=Beta vulgaris subsp. vulgaris TaxID=3555 RepID=UPI0025471E12|nr:uncharacterized protein LOC130591707 [Beta vulgaris subsp. vulgaris]
MKNSQHVEGHIALKLDMSKAYDRIKWDFLDEVLKKYGFAVDWKAEENNSLRGIKVAPTAPSVNHLLFADDCVIFSRATIHDAEAIQEALRVYELSSGQKVNFDKTTLSFSKGVRDSRRGEIEQKLGVRVVEVHDRYLGLPTTVGRSKKVITKGVKEKLWKKLQGCKGMILSKAGREVMIKAVAQSLPTYAMSVFKFPSSFCDEIRSLIAQFWWGKKLVKGRSTGLLGRNYVNQKGRWFGIPRYETVQLGSIGKTGMASCDS